MKIITLTAALVLAVISAMLGSRASAPIQQLVVFDVDPGHRKRVCACCDRSPSQ